MVKRKKRGKVACNFDMEGCKGGCGGAVYGLGFVGSVIYYVSTATSFGMGVLGLLKSIVWPAFLVFEAFKFLGA
ncbi:hypothetical protein ACFLZZ_00475 [Nanoarchaeota archaeon]